MKNIITVIFLLINLGLHTVYAETKKGKTIKPHTTIVNSVVTKDETFNINSNNKYDKAFKKYTKKHLPSIDYRFIKAVCSVESRLNPKAKSKEGARGLCQIMPSTWHFLYKNIDGVKHNSYDNPDDSINVAAYYFSKLNLFWGNIENKQNKLKILLASYNAGEGNISKAKKLNKNNDSYESISKNLKKITGSRSKETLAYVNNVMLLYENLN